MNPAPTTTALDLVPHAKRAQQYSRVSPAQAIAIVRLRQANPALEGKEIARAIGVHPSTVSRWLQILNTDTVPEARKLMRSQALRATMKIVDQVEHTDPRVSQGAAKSIIATAGVAELAPVMVGVQIIVGSPGNPAGPDPFDVVAEVTSAVNGRIP